MSKYNEVKERIFLAAGVDAVRNFQKECLRELKAMRDKYPVFEWCLDDITKEGFESSFTWSSSEMGEVYWMGINEKIKNHEF